MERDPNFPFPRLEEANELRSRMGKLSAAEVKRLIFLEEMQEARQRVAERSAGA